MSWPTAAVAMALLLAGCSGDGKPTVVPPLPSPSATSSPTPSAQALTRVAVPVKARVHDAFGATAFVRFYYDQVNRAYVQADPRGLSDLTDPACLPCKQYEKATALLARQGQHMRGVAGRVLTAEAPPEQNGFVAVDVVLDSPARALVNGSGVVVKSLPPATPVHLAVYLEHVPRGWLVRTIEKAS